MRELSGRAFNVVMRVVTGLPFRDTQCGFKLFRKMRRRRFFRDRWRKDSVSTWKIWSLPGSSGCASIEVPVEWSNVEGTKVSLAQGMKSFADLVQHPRARRYGEVTNKAQRIKKATRSYRHGPRVKLTACCSSVAAASGSAAVRSWPAPGPRCRPEAGFATWSGWPIRWPCWRRGCWIRRRPGWSTARRPG